MRNKKKQNYSTGRTPHDKTITLNENWSTQEQIKNLQHCVTEYQSERVRACVMIIASVSERRRIEYGHLRGDE